ncbi:winged helix-turn-helix domain-containing protein [Cytobacillus oceanisediminis]|uniref:winged helix-turn-helix domain-containing protein n=1 Tax=Cytobacillus oceanisediminis TaxID=665099 RepID=UPI00398D387E
MTTKPFSLSAFTITLQIGSILIQSDSRRVFVNDEEKMFTAKEFDLLKFLVENPNIAFTKEHLMERIWGKSKRTPQIRNLLKRFGVSVIVL